MSKGKVQGQQQDAFEQPLGEGQVRIQSQAGPLMHGFAPQGSEVPIRRAVSHARSSSRPSASIS